MKKGLRVVAVALAGLTGLAAGCRPDDRGGLNDEQLTAMVDSLLPGIVEASGLELREPVRHGIQTRKEARSFIEQQLDEEIGSGDLGGMERAYQLFGLLPDTLQLRDLLLELLTEQVVGYYDPASDRLYVVEGADAETAGPVVAHELVHALQDQHTDLDSLIAAPRGNDRQAAAQAAAEGQAMLVMVALQAAETTGRPLNPAALPDLGAMMEPALEAENEQFPVFGRSPRLIRETLIFPYVGGASFVQALFRHSPEGTTPVPFGELLPQSTEQVLEPERAFFGEGDAPTEIELSPAGGDWSTTYSNTLGQLEVGILLSELTGQEAAASGWDGDRYAVLSAPGDRAALVWYSVWDDEAAADGVADTLRRAAESWTVERVSVGGRPVVRVLIPDQGSSAEDAESAVDVWEDLPAIVALDEGRR